MENKKIKGPIKFKINLNDEQRQAKWEIKSKAVALLTGKAGTGKTLLSCLIALDMLFNKEVDQIVITRPTVSEEELGFLPGSVEEKLQPWVQPIYDNLYDVYDKKKIDELIEKNIITILPISYIRGRTLVNKVFIVDEVQNLSKTQIKAVLTRLGNGSKFLLCGDHQQNDLGHKSGMKLLTQMADKLDDVIHIKLEKNHRHPLVEQILDYLESQEEIPFKFN